MESQYGHFSLDFVTAHSEANLWITTDSYLEKNISAQKVTIWRFTIV